MRVGRSHAGEWVALVATLVCVLPVVFLYVTSLKSEAEILNFKNVVPTEPTLDSYRYLMNTPEEVPMRRWLFNSLFISGSVTFLVLAVSSLAAYGLARLNLPGRRIVFAMIIATLMVPGQVLLVPVYLLLNNLGWLDTPLALIVPPAAGAFGVFLLHQFFKGVPRELEEAAAIDGCSRLATYWFVMLPLARPVLATLGILTFIGTWNDFLGPLVFMDSIEKLTLPVGVALFQSSYANDYSLTFAACVICTTPILIVFLIFSRHIIAGMTAGALKD